LTRLQKGTGGRKKPSFDPQLKAAKGLENLGRLRQMNLLVNQYSPQFDVLNSGNEGFNRRDILFKETWYTAD
jgi:hypothetical protein